jgi:hypothetical protein
MSLCLKSCDERIVRLKEILPSALEVRLTIGGEVMDWSWGISVAEETQLKFVCLQSGCGMAGKKRR